MIPGLYGLFHVDLQQCCHIFHQSVFKDFDYAADCRLMQTCPFMHLRFGNFSKIDQSLNTNLSCLLVNHEHNVTSSEGCTHHPISALRSQFRRLQVIK